MNTSYGLLAACCLTLWSQCIFAQSPHYALNHQVSLLVPTSYQVSIASSQQSEQTYTDITATSAQHIWAARVEAIFPTALLACHNNRDSLIRAVLTHYAIHYTDAHKEGSYCVDCIRYYPTKVSEDYYYLDYRTAFYNPSTQQVTDCVRGRLVFVEDKVYHFTTKKQPTQRATPKAQLLQIKQGTQRDFVKMVRNIRIEGNPIVAYQKGQLQYFAKVRLRKHARLEASRLRDEAYLARIPS